MSSKDREEKIIDGDKDLTKKLYLHKSLNLEEDANGDDDDDNIFIASFDIGKVNFAFCIERCSMKDIAQKKCETSIEEMCSKGKIEIVDNVRLVAFPKLVEIRGGRRKGKSRRLSGKYTFESLFIFLEQRKDLWNKCHIFVIEQQVTQNKEGLKISYHLEAYFKMCYGTFKEVILFPAHHKTRVFNSHEKVYSKRKKACVDEAVRILNKRKDFDTISKIERSQKKDDMCDVICQLQAYKWLHLMEK